MDKTGMLANSKAAAAAARAAGATVIHAPITFAEGYSEITGSRTGSSRASSTPTPSSRAPGAPNRREMAPEAGDIVVEGKRGLDAFASTNLDFILRSKGIKNVALGGFLTNCCVESTMRSAYEKGFNVLTLTDCVAATSMAEQDSAIARTTRCSAAPPSRPTSWPP